MTQSRQIAPPTQVGDTLLLPIQPPFGSQVRVNGGTFGGLEFELVTADSWLCRHRGRAIIESWPTLLHSAKSAGVTVIRLGPAATT